MNLHTNLDLTFSPVGVYTFTGLSICAHSGARSFLSNSVFIPNKLEEKLKCII